MFVFRILLTGLKIPLEMVKKDVAQCINQKYKNVFQSEPKLPYVKY